MSSRRTQISFDAADLDRFRAVQALAYRCAEDVAQTLRPGVTERQASAHLERLLRENGAEDWFHVPFAWFGDRTTLRGMRNPLRFFPSSRSLEIGMPYILDVAPIVGGFTADIGYAGCLGPNAIFDRMIADLEEYRGLVLEGVRARKKLSEIYEDVDALAARHGYEPAHHAYPGKVLAHQVWHIEGPGPRTVVAGFGNRTLRRLGRTLMVGLNEGWSPLWNGGHRSDHAPVPGVWAIEPHLGFHGVGVKFEELLVVTHDDAYYLDDDLPHVRRWAAAEKAGAEKVVAHDGV
jgi:Xaa-Pro aminopeptidase